MQSALIVALGIAVVAIADRRRPNAALALSATPSPLHRRALPDSPSVEPTPVTHPGEIPAEGWKGVLQRTWRGFNTDRILLVAAGVTFYLLLAIFPAVSALVSLYGFFADRSGVGAQIDLLVGLLPAGGLDLLRDEATRIATSGQSTLSAVFLFGLAVSIWSANAGMKGLFEAMNVVYEEQENRSFIRLNAWSLAFTFGALLFALAALGAIVLVPIILDYVGLERSGAAILSLARWPLLFFSLVLALAILYRYGPSRNPAPSWRWITWGSAAASALWLVASILFSWYVANFGSYNATYGSLGAAIGFMTWIWISITVVLVGGELNSQIERQAGRKTTPD
ncbi:YihY/virulence factor BrkB family protein [Methylocella silvestris]|nr:YihY/virulence factor BrkB family protein [Methylocella silvestris]